MDKVVAKEARILADVNKFKPPARDWMLSAIAEIGKAPNAEQVEEKHVAAFIEKCPDRKAFAEEVKRYVSFHVYGTKEETDSAVAQARREARDACVELERIIYG